MAKAKFKSKMYINHTPVLTYEYRGYEYDVIDYGWYGEPLRWQHENEQAHIDELIAITEKTKNSSYEAESADIALEKFFKYCEDGIWED